MFERASSAADVDQIRAALRASVEARRQRSGSHSGQSSAGPGLDDVDIPCEPVTLSAYTRYLIDSIVPECANVLGPFCLAHMTTIVPGVIAPIAELAIALNQNLVKTDASGILTAVERATIGRLHKLVFHESPLFYATHVHRRDSTLGLSTTGGTISNLTALWIARNAALHSPAADMSIGQAGVKAALGRQDAGNVVLIGSDALHYSIRKAADVLGLGEQGCIQVPADARCRVSAARVHEAIVKSRARGDIVMAIVGTAGTTDCGSIDPLADLADVAREFGIHFHVDAAWGGPLLLSRRHCRKLAGIERADSVTFDGHKLMHLPIANSYLLLRDPSLASAIEKRAPYMLREHSGDLGARSLEGSRSAASLVMHAALHLIGQRQYEKLIDASSRVAHVMAAEISRRPEFELLVPPSTSIVLYRYLPLRLRDRARAVGLTAADNAAVSGLNTAIQQEQMRSGAGAVSTTLIPYGAAGTVTSVSALRAIISHPDTTEVHVRCVLDEQVRIAAKLESAAALPAV